MRAPDTTGVVPNESHYRGIYTRSCMSARSRSIIPSIPISDTWGGAVYFVLPLLRTSCADMQAKYYVVIVTLLLVFLPEAHAQGGDGDSETHRAAFIVLTLANQLIYSLIDGTERGGERKRAVQIFLEEICSSLKRVLQDKDEWGKLVKSVDQQVISTKISFDRVAKDSEACDKFMRKRWHYYFKTAEMLPTAHPAPQEDTKFGVEISCGELVHLARTATSTEEVEKWLEKTLLVNIDLMSSADEEINQQLDEIIFDPGKKESTLGDKRVYRCKLSLDGSTEVMKSQVLQDDTSGLSLIVPSNRPPHEVRIASPHEHSHDGPAFSSKELIPTRTEDSAYEFTMSSSEKTGSPQEGQDGLAFVRESSRQLGPSVSMPSSEKSRRDPHMPQSIQKSSVVLECPQRSSSSEHGKNLLSSLRHSSTAGKYFHQLESMHRTGISTKELEQLEHLLKCMEKLMKGGSEVISLSHHDSVSQVSHVELLRVLIANQVFLAGGGSQVCLLCNHQGPSRSTINCHIFPECLLKVYRDVHNLQEECFIYDCVREENVGPESLTYKLFCGECDGEASTSEKMMKVLYLEVNENYPKRTRAPIIDRQNEKWSICYLIALMFLRGLIVNEDLMDIIYNSKHCKLVLGAIMWLLDFAKNRTEPPKIFQYLVPLEPLNKQLTDTQYCYNMHLRCLQFTRFYEEEEGPFLYLQFDFFHWILPLDDSMISYLQKSIENGEKALLTVEDSTEFLSEDQRKLIYPDILVRISGMEAEKLSRFLRSPPKLVTDHHRMFLGLHRSSTDSDHYACWIKPESCQQTEIIDIEMTEKDCVKWKGKQPRPNSVHHLCSNQEICSLQRVVINTKKENKSYVDKLRRKLRKMEKISYNFKKEIKMLTDAVRRKAKSEVEDHKKMLELGTKKALLCMEEVVQEPPLSAMELSLPASSTIEASLPASSEVEPSLPPSSAVATEPSLLIMSSSIVDTSLPNASLPTLSEVEPSVPAITALPESNAMHGRFSAEF